MPPPARASPGRPTRRGSAIGPRAQRGRDRHGHLPGAVGPHAGATLVVELRDVSYADAHAPLIARQTITGPGQVPISFNVGYHRDDIDSGNLYAIHAKIIESDGRLAFTNDTAYEVITHGNPDKVDMLLVLVQPPPDLVGEDGAGSDWRTWVEAPVHVVWANLIPNEPEPVLRVAYYQSTIEGCARPGSEGLELDGRDIIVRVTLMQPPSTPWAIPCAEEVVELDTVLPSRRRWNPARPTGSSPTAAKRRPLPSPPSTFATRSSPSHRSRARRLS